MHPRQATALVALACLFVAGLGESAVTADYGNAAVIPGVGDELLESAPLLTLSSPQFPSKPAKSSVSAKTPCPPTSPETIRQPTSPNPGYGTTDPQEHEPSHADNQHYQITKLSEKEDTSYQPKPKPKPYAPTTGGRPSRGGHESGRFNDEGRDNQHHHRQPARTEDNHNYAKTDLPEKEDTPYQPKPKPNAPATGGRPSRGGHESGRLNGNANGNGRNLGGDKKFVKTEYAPKHDQKLEDKKKVGPPHRDQPKSAPKPHIRRAGGAAAYSTP